MIGKLNGGSRLVSQIDCSVSGCFAIIGARKTGLLWRVTCTSEVLKAHSSLWGRLGALAPHQQCYRIISVMF